MLNTIITKMLGGKAMLAKTSQSLREMEMKQ